MAELFPRASDRDIDPKSASTDEYNCIAWAVWHQGQIIWPDSAEQMGWPPELDRVETIEVFEAFFAMVGYARCADGTPERGFEKVVLYADGGLVTHAARLQANGKWTSKLGGGVDAEHPNPETVASKTYGWPICYMKRRNTGKPVLPKLHPAPFAIIGTLGQGLIRGSS